MEKTYLKKSRNIVLSKYWQQNNVWCGPQVRRVIKWIFFLLIIFFGNGFFFFFPQMFSSFPLLFEWNSSLLEVLSFSDQVGKVECFWIDKLNKANRNKMTKLKSLNFLALFSPDISAHNIVIKRNCNKNIFWAMNFND